MRTLPPKMVQALAPFAPLFSKRVFQHAQLLLIGAILAPGRRTISSALRAMGQNTGRYYQCLMYARIRISDTLHKKPCRIGQGLCRTSKHTNAIMPMVGRARTRC
jgi:hypothetical protein